MYLSYLDESQSNPKRTRNPHFVLSAVLVHDELFDSMEIKATVVVEMLLPEERREQFEEFKACELFGGYGLFEGIPAEQRFTCIRTLLSTIPQYKLPVISTSVDLNKLNSRDYASALPHDMAFRRCMAAIQNLAFAVQPTAEIAILILDDMTDKNIKDALKKSFRSHRPHLHDTLGYAPGPYWNLHDAMYFGDSKDSVGLQLADLCSFFIRRHEERNDSDPAEEFYRIFSEQIKPIVRLPEL